MASFLTPPSSSAESSLSREDVEAILNTMFFDQEEHQFYSFCPTYAKYRSIVCQWMLDLGDFFNLHETTSHAAIAYLDRLQPNEKFSRNQWQMLGISCLIMAAKYNENEEHVPELAALQSITQQEIPREELLKYEIWALQRMGWILCARTVPAFLSCYQSLGCLFEADLTALLSLSKARPIFPSKEQEKDFFASELSRLDSIVRKQCSALATMVALDVRFKSFPCSMVAAAVLYVSRRCLGLPLDDAWPRELVLTTRYAVEDLIDLVNMIDRTSEEITRWVQSNNKSATESHMPPSETVLCVTPKKPNTNDAVVSLDPSNAPAEVTMKPHKYSYESETVQLALKRALAEDSIDKFSPSSITDQIVNENAVN